MKPTIARLLICCGFLALAVACKPSFTGTQISTNTIASNANSGNTNQGLYIDYTLGAGNVDITSSVTAGTATKQLVSITIHNGNVDATASSLSAIHFYNLTNTAAADGGYTRGTAITPASVAWQYNANTDTTTLRYLFDMSIAANFSNPIELYIDPTVLTANQGRTRLDIDGTYQTNHGEPSPGEWTQGEAQDDAVEYYISVVSGTAATGLPSDPRALLFPAYVPASFTTTAIGTTTLTLNYAYVTWDNTNMKAAFDSSFQLQKFNMTSGSWNAVSLTSTYNTTTGVYTVTIPATAARENYRWNLLNPSSLTSGKTIQRYTLRASTNETIASWIMPGAYFTIVDSTPATYSTTATYNATVNFDGTAHNGVVTVSVSGIGTQGLGGVSTSTVKLFDSANNLYPPVSSVSVGSSVTANDSIIIMLNPAYQRSAGGANNLQLQISPNVMDVGNSLILGDYTNTSAVPFGWRIVNLAFHI